MTDSIEGPVSRDFPFQTLVEGCFDAEHLTSTWTPHAGRLSNPETERLIEATWLELENVTKPNGSLMTNQPLCRLLSWHTRADTLTLNFGPTNFRDLMGTNERHPEIARLYGRGLLANATGVSSVVVTADDQLAVQRRHTRMLQYPGWYHVCGGSLEPTNISGNILVKPFDAIKTELREELEIHPQYITDIRCLGLAEDRTTYKPEINFATWLNVPAARFAQQVGPEHDQLLLLPDTPHELGSFLLEHADRIVPVGFACLLLYGSRRFGSIWRDSLVNALSPHTLLPPCDQPPD